MADVVATRPLGPQECGRRMTLEQFKSADVEEDFNYELAQGVLVVAELPSYFHLVVVLALRNALVAYQLRHVRPNCSPAARIRGRERASTPIAC